MARLNAFGTTPLRSDKLKSLVKVGKVWLRHFFKISVGIESREHVVDFEETMSFLISFSEVFSKISKREMRCSSTGTSSVLEISSPVELVI